jgi:KUP system potassium uptake protein
MTEKTKFSYPLTLGALGVVYGDIGTSPLYALQVTLGTLPVNLSDILGILSLIFWSLLSIISIKYLMIIFRADNHGEGGILALFALLNHRSTKYGHHFYLVAIFGAGLLLADGMLTPAISVSSAVEGLATLSPMFKPFILPIATIILFFIFLLQSRGTGRLGAIFGPLIFVWFITIALLGLMQIIENPIVLKAVNPYYALNFLYGGGRHSYFLLGSIFLVVTGGEALYADMGHFGKNPIRYSWFAIVFPSLILNYFGQGAYLLAHPLAIENPFYMIAPSWFSIPLLIIATVATVIASQAVISAIFSLTKQAILLDFCPRIPIVHTSQHQGQIYVPQINSVLLIGTLALLLTFKNSENLAHAYGIAVNLYMLLITVMVAYTAFYVWQWSSIRIIMVFTLFFLIDLAFLGANSHKFLTGGWVPVVVAFFVAFIMCTWNRGLNYLRENFYLKKEGIKKILVQLNYRKLTHLPSITSIFITDAYDKSGGSFLHFLKLSMAVPEHVLIVSYTVENIPYVHDNNRFNLECLDERVYRVTLCYGFKDIISIPKALKQANDNHRFPFPFLMQTATYIVEIPNIIASNLNCSTLHFVQEQVFAFLMRNYSANLNIEFYQLPHNKTIAIGAYCVI